MLNLKKIILIVFLIGRFPLIKTCSSKRYIWPLMTAAPAAKLVRYLYRGADPVKIARSCSLIIC